MNFLGKNLIFMVVLTGVAVQGAELEVQAAQRELDKQLLEAVKKDRTDAMRTLLLQKANPDCKILNEKKAIAYAIDKGNVDVVELLLCQCANANGTSDAATPLLLATISHIDNYIIFHDKKVDRADLYVYIADLLFYHGADPNKCYFNSQALEICMNSDRFHVKPACDLAGLLVRYGADHTVTDRCGKNIYDHAEKNPELQSSLDHHLKDRRAKTASFIAAAIPKIGLGPVGVITRYIL